MKRILWVSGGMLALVVLVLGGIILWDLPPLAEREFFAFKWDWDQARMTAKTKSPDERKADKEKFSNRGLALAKKYPGTTCEMACLMTLDERVPQTDVGRTATEMLAPRIAQADLKLLWRALNIGPSLQISDQTAAPALLQRVKQNLDHPQAPELLVRVACTFARDETAESPPPGFIEVADLIVDRFLEHPMIFGFCDALGNGTGSVRWSPQFETHLDRILKSNQQRFVQCSALMAKAQIAQLSVERQDEAEAGYRDLLAKFHVEVNDQWKHVVAMKCHWAQLQLDSMEYAPIGRQVPELTGFDLQGRPMSLSDHQGKVVLLTFWASWCYPCMKLVPHEKELAERFAGQPFAIVGVNADEDPGYGAQIESEKSITWRSFQDHRDQSQAISDHWKALFPTVYLIDHKGVMRHRYSIPNPDDIRKSLEELIAAANADSQG